MARLTGSRTLFFTTSPRTPAKMVPEIQLLSHLFEGEEWNSATQQKFMEQLLLDEGNFHNRGGAKDLEFAARDRINRGPKALGFVDLKPFIHITDAGRSLILEERTEEIFLRQLLKFQLPSPYHKVSRTEENRFNIKPYLEIMRLVDHFGSLGFDEMMLFGLQLTDYNRFIDVVDAIELFRIEKQKNVGKYSTYRKNVSRKIIESLYEQEIADGSTRTRQSRDQTIDKFVRTKLSNMRDYADACFRYLRATGLFDISQRGKSLSVAKEKREDVKFLLKEVTREPIFIDDEKRFKNYIFDPLLPVLYSDNRENLLSQLSALDSRSEIELNALSTNELKKRLADKLSKAKSVIIGNEIDRIKKYEAYDNIIDTFNDISSRKLYDSALMLEWNTWRAMTMIDGGSIQANLKFDDNGNPMSTAQGNVADIICNYDTFNLTVEVTLSSGQRQYESEGEPVARHLASLKKSSDKPAYCLFIAPTLSEACISFFYMLHKTNINYYLGKSVIVPITLSTFEKMVSDSHKAAYIPTEGDLERIFKSSIQSAAIAADENEWYKDITHQALHWLK